MTAGDGRLRERAPLVHCIVPKATMALVVDALAAIGARPMMTEAPGEAPQLAARADALIVNLGTLSTDGTAGAPLAALAAGAFDVPWVLDPAAVGPTVQRRSLAALLLRMQPSVIRGNASEIATLADLAAAPRRILDTGRNAGPDSTLEVEQVRSRLRELALATGSVVSCSGAVDLVDDGTGLAEHRGGHARLAQLVGSGCVLGAITAAWSAVLPPAQAALTALRLVATAAERAAERADGPGGYRTAWIDALAEVHP